MAEIFGNGIALTEKVLDFLWGRQTITLNNIANGETPKFKSQYITFEEEMAERLSQASASGKGARQAVADAIDATHASVHTTTAESTRLDDNNVDMDQEQVEIVRTAYEYQYMLSSFNNDMNRLKSAARTF